MRYHLLSIKYIAMVLIFLNVGCSVVVFKGPVGDIPEEKSINSIVGKWKVIAVEGRSATGSNVRIENVGIGLYQVSVLDRSNICKLVKFYVTTIGSAYILNIDLGSYNDCNAIDGADVDRGLMDGFLPLVLARKGDGYLQYFPIDGSPIVRAVQLGDLEGAVRNCSDQLKALTAENREKLGLASRRGSDSEKNGIDVGKCYVIDADSGGLERYFEENLQKMSLESDAVLLEKVP